LIVGFQFVGLKKGSPIEKENRTPGQKPDDRGGEDFPFWGGKKLIGQLPTSNTLDFLLYP
jgi:hypothetical protein